MQHGVEARHLRMYRTTTEREAGFSSSVVMPLVKQRNPRTRQQAIDMVERAGPLGGQHAGHDAATRPARVTTGS